MSEGPARPRRGQELHREQSLVDLEQVLGDRGQLLRDRDQARADRDQTQLDNDLELADVGTIADAREFDDRQA
jgi:hypothetical protein